METKLSFFLIFILSTGITFGTDNHSHALKHDSHASANPVVLKEAGNDAFGTIQEVLGKLNENPNTDWSKVDLEALRQHLLDMNDMVLHAEVVSRRSIAEGLEIGVKPTTKRAGESLKRVFSAHPAQLFKETGWVMDVKEKDGFFRLRVTTKEPREIKKIRGLGYIGLMANGSHHQPHHWAIANGENPHSAQH